MSKRILSFLLVLTMVLGLFPATVLATQTGDTSVTVTFTASHGEKFYTPEESGKVMIQQQLTIPYFDLALYGLEEYYYNPDCYSAGGGNPELQKPGTAETAEGIVTVMHLFIYATEIFKCELSPEEAGKGYLYEEGLIAGMDDERTGNEIISWVGNAGSSFMTFWDDYGTNLNYYINYAYPLGAMAWGSTSDQQKLADGDMVSLHGIQDSSAYGSNFTFFKMDEVWEQGSAVRGDQVELTLWHSQPDWELFLTNYRTGGNETVYYTSASALTDGAVKEWTELGTTDENGVITVDTSTLAAGEYIIAVKGFDAPDEGIQYAPGAFKLTVEKAPYAPTVTVSQNGEEFTAEDTGVDYNGTNVLYVKLPAYTAPTVVSDGLNEEVGGARRYLRVDGGTTSSGNLPRPLGMSGLTTAEAVQAIYGEIPGLEDADTNLFMSVPVRYNSSGDLLYVLVLEFTITRVESITLDKNEATVNGGEQLQLTAAVDPGNATFPTVTWTSSDANVAEVDANGLVSCWNDGEAVITATADGKSAECVVTVTNGVVRPTVLFSGSGWPHSGNGITSLKVHSVAVEDILVNGSNCYITLDPATADDAGLKLEIVATGSRGTSVKVDGELLLKQTTGTVEREYQLTDGTVSTVIGANPYYNDPTNPNNERYFAYKTFSFSNTGIFPVAPMLSGSASTSTLAVQGESYSLDLSTLFKNVSGNAMTYTVSVDGAEAVPADEAYTYLAQTSGSHKLVFTANNTIGDSPVYTVNLTVVPTAAIYPMDLKTDNGGIAWFAFTTDTNQPLPEGTTVAYDEESKTFNITMPTDIVLNSKVNTYYMASGSSFFTGSNQVNGSTPWSSQIRNYHTSTLSNGKLSTNIYFYDRNPSNADNAYVTYSFNYARVLPEGYFEYEITTDIPANSGWGMETSKIVISGDQGSANGHVWANDRTLNILLGSDTPTDGTVVADFSGLGSFSGNGPVTLVDGQATQTITNASSYGSFFGSTTWTVYYKIGTLPTLAEGVQPPVSATVPCLDTYSLDLSSLFTDPDGDALTYQVRINDGEWTDIEGSVFNYVPQIAQDYTVQLRCFDGFGYSSDIYTVDLTATNAKTLFGVEVHTSAENAQFWCFRGQDENGYPLVGDKLEASRTGNGYSVFVPVNVQDIVMTVGEASITGKVAYENETNVLTFCKTSFDIRTALGDPTEAAVVVTCGESPVKGEGNVFWLNAADTYTYAVTPSGESAADWAPVTLTGQTVSEDATVAVKLAVRAAKTITIDADAQLKVYYQRGYYVMDEVEPVLVVDNGDGTVTYTYSCPKAQAYSCGYMYFATKGDLIDQAGYMMSVTDTTITWEGEERLGSYRSDYDPTTAYGARGDDSVLVNVNPQSHLVLKPGQTFRLRSSRIWEIINTDTENVMIEPTFTYDYDESIISMVTANEVLTDRKCGTGGNNWMDMTVTGSGVTFLEVGYEAVHIVNGFGAGGWGGAAGQADNFTYNAIDPDRTAIVVVQTDGKAATDVDFGIECLSANVNGDFYEEEKAVAWDYEFDTLYFLGDHGTMTLAPDAQVGSIVEMAISWDKGQTWSVLEGNNGIYTADIYSGNNIIRATKEDGTTAYQVVRGDRVTYEITNVSNPDMGSEYTYGDTVRITFNGLHNPVGKMSGIYNPGFGQGQRVTYSFNGEDVRQNGYYQYNFVSNAWIEVTIGTDDSIGYALTGGYINFNVLGDTPGNHRSLTDSGRGVNTTAASSKYTRSLLPDIVLLYACETKGCEYDAVVTAPTCEDMGYTTYTCIHCGDSYVSDMVPSGDHSYEAVVTEPTCTELGYTTHTCTVCGESYTDSYVAPTGHTYTSQVTKEATCAEEGVMTYTCECGHSYTEAIARAEHQYESKVTEPTCESVGYTTHTCAVCGDSYVDSIVEAKGHDYTAQVTEPTCTAAGYTTYTCACGDTYVDDIVEAKGHNYTDVVTEPTHDKMGYTTHTCDCGHSYVDSYVDALGHDYTAKVTLEPTCTTEGIMTFTCECGETYTEAIPVAAHEYTAAVTEPTCESMGYTTYTCACGESYVADYVDALGHDCQTTVVEATCEGYGYTINQCVNCDHSYISSITEPTGHTGETVGTLEAGWHNDGYTGDLICSVCGQVLELGEVIPAMGCPAAIYTDVDTTRWYHEAVDYVTANGLMNGTGHGLFQPDSETTRAMMATLLYRIAGEPSVEGLSNPFVDVPADKWYTNAVIWAAGEGIVKGVSADVFAPDESITRQQMVTMLHRFAGEPEADLLVLADYTDGETVSDYSVTAMAWAVETGLINGVNEDTLAPKGTATRAQIAAILMRYLES